MNYHLLDTVARYHNYEPDELLQAIASGELATILLPDEQRSAAIKWLYEQSMQVNDMALNEALASIAKQLEAAAMRESEE